MATAFFDARSKNARALLEGDLQVVEQPEAADLVWLRGGHKKLAGRLRAGQLINYIPGESALIDKGYLSQYLKLHEPGEGDPDLELEDFYPETFCLYDPEERRAFFEQLPPEESPEQLWILKPADMSMGRGVGVTWRFEGLRQLYEMVEREGADDEIRPYIVQRYITNPLLLDGRKSEIRLYWLIASVDPLLALVYGEGTVRLNNQPFSLGDLDNELVHVTNVFQQKRHPDFDAELELKWSLPDLETYIVERLGRGEFGLIEAELKPKLKAILQFALEATRHVLEPGPDGPLGFNLLGVDVILDDTLRPWLTEVQLGPGLSHGDQVKREVLPGMLREAAQIVLEVQRRRRQGGSLAHLDSVSRFEWIANEAARA